MEVEALQRGRRISQQSLNFKSFINCIFYADKCSSKKSVNQHDNFFDTNLCGYSLTFGSGCKWICEDCC